MKQAIQYITKPLGTNATAIPIQKKYQASFAYVY